MTGIDCATTGLAGSSAVSLTGSGDAVGGGDSTTGVCELVVPAADELVVTGAGGPSSPAPLPQPTSAAPTTTPSSTRHPFVCRLPRSPPMPLRIIPAKNSQGGAQAGDKHEKAHRVIA